jgi:hypothetical protein
VKISWSWWFFLSLYFTPLYLQRDEETKTNSEKAGVTLSPVIKWCTWPFINFLEFVHLFYKISSVPSLLVGSKSDMELNYWTKQVEITGVASVFYLVFHTLLSTPLPSHRPHLQGLSMSVTIFKERFSRSSWCGQSTTFRHMANWYVSNVFISFIVLCYYNITFEYFL